MPSSVMLSAKEKIDFSRFGKSFQENLCRILLDNRQFCDQIGEVLDTGFFELRYLQVFSKIIYDYKKEYGTHPSRTTMVSILKSSLENYPQTVQSQIRSFFAKTIISSDVDTEGDEYIKKMSLDFCRKQKLKEAMIKSAKLLNSSSFEEISKLVNEALKLGGDNNFGYDYLVDFEERFVLRHRNPVSTGWPQIDAITEGGLGKGELGVVIAPTGAGKSMVLVHLGAQAVMQGKTVVYYTLELEDKVVASRFDSCMTKIPLKELMDFKDVVYEKVTNVHGSLIVKEYPTKHASTETLKNHLHKLKTKGIEPDVVIIDYGDLLKPVRFRKETRNELQEIYEELRGIAKLHDCLVWTASQTNRGALNAEVVTMESISEAFNKCFVADFIFTLSRTIEDKATNTGRFFIAKNRNGVDGIVLPIYMDTSNVEIYISSEELTEVSEVVKNAAKKQEEMLKKKYESFKKKRN